MASMQEAAPQTTDIITLKCPILALVGLSARVLAWCKIIIGPELSALNTKGSRGTPKRKLFCSGGHLLSKHGSQHMNLWWKITIRVPAVVRKMLRTKNGQRAGTREKGKQR